MKVIISGKGWTSQAIAARLLLLKSNRRWSCEEQRILTLARRYHNRVSSFLLSQSSSLGLGIDEETALCGEPGSEGEEWNFSVRGRQSAWLLERGGSKRIDKSIRLKVNDAAENSIQSYTS